MLPISSAVAVVDVLSSHFMKVMVMHDGTALDNDIDGRRVHRLECESDIMR